jgi:hypothetical protein
MPLSHRFFLAFSRLARSTNIRTTILLSAKKTFVRLVLCLLLANHSNFTAAAVGLKAFTCHHRRVLLRASFVGGGGLFVKWFGDAVVA